METVFMPDGKTLKNPSTKLDKTAACIIAAQSCVFAFS